MYAINTASGADIPIKLKMIRNVNDLEIHLTLQIKLHLLSLLKLLSQAATSGNQLLAWNNMSCMM